MPIAKAERLMNLALCLMNTRRPLTKRELRESIEAYREAGESVSEDAFNRMFERDKDDLRELGLVIDTAEASVDGDIGYLAQRDRNRLPEISLDAEEAAALSLVAGVWRQARLADAGRGALQKLRAAGGLAAAVATADVPGATASGSAPATGQTALEPHIVTPEAAFEPLLAAARDRRPVSFHYRKAGAAEPEPRTVEPWALECWHGHWYLAGWDRDREAVRVFRLSRVTGRVRNRPGSFGAEVPDHVDVRAQIARFAGEGATATARVRVRREAAFPLRTRALHTEPVGADWDELEIPFGRGLAADLTEFGADVEVLAPPELRSEVAGRLRAVARGEVRSA
ncbi:helix-turn-helix transcriptional regulator [Phaeacidiphilus oryzae]|uniref:helix-turn-helix transcriptional regulator n=1 Tax=Phaeacidiphilus oryzae TaxID=348818 RepID=UPI000565CFDA|nr:WYL domain-containing protein [Phaeacidiphilus oryzae]